MSITRTFAACSLAALSFSSVAAADEVEVYLTDMLDNIQVGYCLDIAGGKEYNVDIEDGLQGHTCYSNLGALGADQVFDTERFADGELFMTNFDVCAELESTSEGASIGLADCDGSDLQTFTFTGEGVISPASAPEMCLTVGEDTRSGRSDTNQIKVLSLEACSDAQAGYQEWAVRGVE
ncbi:RICIN domain-containing protein [Octadecabacter sp.]|nr:RICIN domain-containing protein [Octadecabacter sp.]